MKKTIKSLLICILLVALISCVVACDSSSGIGSEITISYFREDGQFVFPIKVTKASMSPNPVKYFRSYQSLEKIAKSIQSTSEYNVTSADGYLIIKTSDNQNCCIIVPCENGRYNYLITNMGCAIKSPNYTNYEIEYHQIIVPLLDRRIKHYIRRCVYR